MALLLVWSTVAIKWPINAAAAGPLPIRHHLTWSGLDYYEYCGLVLKDA